MIAVRTDSEAVEPVTATGRHADWARRAAQHYLERYASSEANLVRVLLRKLQRRARLDPGRWLLAREDGERIVADAVASCRALGLVDDRSFADTKVAGGRRRGYSAARLKAAMSAKGVSRDVAAEAIGRDPVDDERAAIVFARRRRLGPFRERYGDNPPADRQRDMAKLCAQGFPIALARRVIAFERSEAEALLISDPDA